MSKAVLLSVNPMWCHLIVDGKKTIEVRKTRPKIDTPFKCYIYETKGKTEYPTFIDEEGHAIYEGRGQVIGEFICDKIDRLYVPYPAYQNEFNNALAQKSLVDYWMCHRYARSGATLYCWNINVLKVYDTPKYIGEFKATCDHRFDELLCSKCQRFEKETHRCSGNLKRAPQSWFYVEEL